MSIEIRPSSSLVDDYCWVRAALERSQLECIALKEELKEMRGALSDSLFYVESWEPYDTDSANKVHELLNRIKDVLYPAKEEHP